MLTRRLVRISVAFPLALVAACAGAVPPAHPGTASSTPVASETGALPEHPSQDDVRGALSGVSAAINRCAAQAPRGELYVTVLFGSSGTVQSAHVVLPTDLVEPGSPRSTVALDEASHRCVTEVLLAVRVPPFRQPTVVVRFPYAVP